LIIKKDKVNEDDVEPWGKNDRIPYEKSTKINSNFNVYNDINKNSTKIEMKMKDKYPGIYI
jgi:hypothetical protein